MSVAPFAAASLAVCFLLLAPAPAGAQSAPPHAASPERPSVATHAQTVAPGWIEIEGGVERPRAEGRFGDTGLATAVKLGLSQRTQLTVAPTLSRPGAGSLALDAVSAGIKVRVLDEAPLVGVVAILPSVTIPTGDARRTDADAASLLFIASRSLGPVSIDLNAGYTRRRGDGSVTPRHESLWAASAGGPMIGRVGWMGELSGTPRTGGPAGRSATVNGLVGVNAAISPAVVLDAATLVPLSGDDHFTLLGGAVWNVGRLLKRRPSSGGHE
jgi:hypothetical protein